jgi:hypothetical protein
MPEQTSFWEVPQPEQDKLRVERASLMALIVELSNEIAETNGVLTPVWAEERRLKQALDDTYARGQGGRALLNFDGIPDRKPLFAGLLAIAEQWGKIKTERNQMVSRLKAYQREAQRITKILEHEKQRKQRKPRGK